MIHDAGPFAKRAVRWAAPAGGAIMPHVVMDRLFVIAGSILGLLGVGLGAFGAHSLRGYFKDHADLEAIYRTATEYQMVHAVALLGVAWAASRWPGPLIHWSGYLLIVGVVVFSGSLYALSMTGIRGFGAITPIGGVALLAGWLCLGIGAWRGAGGR